MKKILICYYSRSHSTYEVCTTLEDILSTEHMVTVKAMDSVTDVTSYDLIILGAPIHGMRWAEEADSFVKLFKKELQNKPLAFFYLSYLLDNSRSFFQKKLKRAFVPYEEIFNIVAKGYLYGKIAAPFPAPARLLFGARKSEPLDRRDWAKVDAFASSISLYLHTSLPQ